MAKSNEVLLILGDQLFPIKNIPTGKDVPILMIEDYELGTHFKYHKNKLIFFLSSMRNYRDSLKEKGFEVEYFDSNHTLFKKDFFEKVNEFLKNNKKINKLHSYEVSDEFFVKKLEDFIKQNKLSYEKHKNPSFLTSKEQFKNYLKRSKKPFMMSFYTEQRKRLKILIDSKGQPIEGKWSFDSENRKKYPKNIKFVERPKLSTLQNTEDVKKVVDKHFKDHPGVSDNFWLPTTRKEALKILDHFVNENINNFGPYEDAIHSEDVFGFHSTLSPLINAGLLLPDEVVDKIVTFGRENKIPISSIEGFVRQIIGWREFVKGIYDNYNEKMESENFWNHKRKMKDSWYKGQTGVLPFDDSVKKTTKYGYVHHIERLMIQSNLMLLSEIHPREVHKWFMEMFVDSADWVMAANVYGMGQMSDGGIFATKPYICGSNYILKMSNYKKDDWCDVMDGLYWRFIERKSDFFSTNPRMGMMVKMLKKLDKDRKKDIFNKAEIFLEKNTD